MHLWYKDRNGNDSYLQYENMVMFRICVPHEERINEI